MRSVKSLILFLLLPACMPAPAPYPYTVPSAPPPPPQPTSMPAPIPEASPAPTPQPVSVSAPSTPVESTPPDNAAYEENKRVSELCTQIAFLKHYQACIVTERSNAAGVVDLAKLHDCGEAVTQLKADIASRKKDYKAQTSKSFDEKSCK